ncbi:MAG: adenine deaminase [Acidobacteriota bacterium]
MRRPESLESLKRRILVARGEEPADLVFVNGQVACTFTGELLDAPVAVAEGRVCSLGPAAAGSAEVVDLQGRILAPAFTDAHIHVESSMLTPEGFAEAVVPHGTGATVSDPHEIVNVLGIAGYDYMRRSSRDLPMDIFWSVPSCVPATHMETAGASLGPEDVVQVLDRYPEAPALSEMMNFPGVLFGMEEVLAKVRAAALRGKPVDGHSPGLSGSGLDAYAGAGILTDHECLTAAEATEKLRRGMWVFLREGSAARNLRHLLPAVTSGTATRICLVSDDRHPEDLLREGHLDATLRKAVSWGLDPMAALRAVTLNPALVYGFGDRGGVAPGFLADLVVLKDLRSFEVAAVYHRGKKVAEAGSLLEPVERGAAGEALSTVRLPPDLRRLLGKFPESGEVRVIGVEPDQIVTRSDTGLAQEAGAGFGMQYAAVVERHRGTGRVGLGYVRGFDLQAGALASTVSHDSHNLVIVGTSPEEMAGAARVVEEMGGGLAAVRGGEALATLPLEVAGLMSLGSAAQVSAAMEALHTAARGLGCTLPAPFMTLSFLALPVIPSLKLTDRGLVDVDRFQFVPLRAP